MTYQQTLDYLFTQLPMYQRQGGAALKKDLSNIRALLNWLGNPHERLRCIHVAGTNGKGTVCHLLAAALQQYGYRVGMYTSPHYKDFRERIKINGAFIPENAVTDFTARLRDAGPGGIAPSFFEITVAMAFEYFAKQNPDYCIIEVGLGGRLDSTNVITPLLSVITNIGLDHTEFLGDTLPLIAGEKAGIIKPGVPVVIGRRQAETEPVFREVADRNEASIYFSDEFWLDDEDSDPSPAGPPVLRRRTTDELFSFDGVEVANNTPMRENMRVALTALAVLDDLGHPAPRPEDCASAWQRLGRLTHYLGRFQRLECGPDLLCLADSGHNEDGIRLAVRWLEGFAKTFHVVLGMVREKDLGKVLPLFPKNARYYFAKAGIPRGLPAEELREAAQNFGLSGETYASVQEAFAAAKTEAQAAGKDHAVFVGGSIFTVAEVL